MPKIQVSAPGVIYTGPCTVASISVVHPGREGFFSFYDATSLDECRRFNQTFAIGRDAHMLQRGFRPGYKMDFGVVVREVPRDMILELELLPPAAPEAPQPDPAPPAGMPAAPRTKKPTPLETP
jgi:hypothetical protein